MRRGLAGQNVSQRAPHVVLECVVLCVVVYDTSDTFLLSVYDNVTPALRGFTAEYDAKTTVYGNITPIYGGPF
ncbi:unnamed protein product [Rotaria socialis]